MKRMFAPVAVMLALSGCGSIPDATDMRATRAWEGRPVADIVDQFGAPHRIDTKVDKQVVELVYVHGTSQTSREALGTYTGPQNGQLVHVESYGDVTRNSQCEVHVTVNRARQVVRVWAQGGYCYQVELRPKQ